MQKVVEDFKFLKVLNKNVSQRGIFAFLADVNLRLNGHSNTPDKDSLIRSLNLSLLQNHGIFSPHLIQLLSELYGSKYKRDRKNISNDQDFLKTLQMIRILHWPMVFEDIFINFIVSIVDSKVQEVCKGNSDKTFYSELVDWLDEVLSGFILDIYASANDNSKVDSLLATIKSKFIYKSISKLRATELFDIIADYPDSLPALTELREATVATDSIGEVGQVFRGIVKKRLLHIGASTSQILDMYILIIKALRVVDSTDLLLNFVSRPVRQYLLERKDTVRCITISLTENTDSNLHGELRKGGAVFVGDVLDEEDDAPPSENWMPRKRNPLLVDTTKSRSNDILAALVSIYGSADVFVQEYRILLAEKLLSNTNYNIDQELATVELLKIRYD
jgi:anaphase-promoting complex subunit 2